MKAFAAFLIAIIAVFVVTASQVFAAGEISGTRFNELYTANFVQDNPDKLIDALNVEFESTGWQAGGQSASPFLVPGGSVLWGDLSTIRLPDNELFPLLVNPQTKIGVYFAQVDVTIPSGRFIRTDLSLCRDMPEWWGFCQQDAVSTAPAAQAVPSVSNGYPADRICPSVRNANDPSQAISMLDNLLQGDGYFYGGELAPGSTIPAGAIFWTNFGSNSGWVINIDFIPLKNSGPWGAFRAVRDLRVPSNVYGRFLVVNGNC